MRLSVLSAALIMFLGVSAAEPANYSSNVSKIDGVCMGRNATGLASADFSEQNGSEILNFSGGIEAATPCRTVNHSVSGRNGSYVLNITTPPDTNRSEIPCIQCVGEIYYKGYFISDEPFRLEIRHKGRLVENVSSPGYGNDSNSAGGKNDSENNSSALIRIGPAENSSNSSNNSSFIDDLNDIVEGNRSNNSSNMDTNSSENSSDQGDNNFDADNSSNGSGPAESGFSGLIEVLTAFINSLV